MENRTYDQQIDKVINEEIPGRGNEMGSWDKDTILNSEDQQQPLNVLEEEQKDAQRDSNDQQKQDWTKKDPDEKPGDDPSNDTDDSDETKKKLPNG